MARCYRCGKNAPRYKETSLCKKCYMHAKSKKRAKKAFKLPSFW